VINPDDTEEDLLLDDIVSIISIDAIHRVVMQSLLAYSNAPPAAKKVPRNVYLRKSSSVQLWDSIWGKELRLLVKRCLELVWIILLEIRVISAGFVFHFRYLKTLECMRCGFTLGFSRYSYRENQHIQKAYALLFGFHDFTVACKMA
jgi:hypothetical protein